MRLVAGELPGVSEASGSAPDARAYFLLLRQKKVAKEKATPGYAVGCADFPALLDGPGGCGTRGVAPQTVLADCPRPVSVARRSTWGPVNQPQLVCCGRPRKTAIFARQPQPSIRFTGPLERRRATQAGAGKGRALSEPRSGELRSPRASRVAQGTGRSPAPTQGCLFLWLLSFWQQKESTPARQARKTAVEKSPAPARQAQEPALNQPNKPTETIAK